MLSGATAQLRLADQAQTVRDDESARTKAPDYVDEDGVKQPGEFYQVADAHRELAARRLEAAQTLLSKDNDFQAYDLIAQNREVTTDVYDYRSDEEREWYNDGIANGKLHVTVWSSTGKDGERERPFEDGIEEHGRIPRQIRLADELASINKDESLEMVSYIDKDWFYDSRARVVPHFDNMGANKTELELGVLGVRRELQGDSPQGEWKYTKWTPATPEQYQRLNDAYNLFMADYSAMQATVFSHSSPWGDDAQLDNLKAYDDITQYTRNSATAVLSRGDMLESDRQLALGGFKKSDAGKFTIDDKSQFRLAIKESKESMTSWQSGYNVTKGVGEFAVATARRAACPCHGWRLAPPHCRSRRAGRGPRHGDARSGRGVDRRGRIQRGHGSARHGAPCGRRDPRARSRLAAAGADVVARS